jgi:hypothetical protein
MQSQWRPSHEEADDLDRQSSARIGQSNNLNPVSETTAAWMISNAKILWLPVRATIASSLPYERYCDDYVRHKKSHNQSV